ncbi:hypothetical protein HY407_00235 [Candidatus Gottesmanbacteria bacterium]|nr:hypothetical protein [Candidatus Gottesmanbacteria bacterium]
MSASNPVFNKPWKPGRGTFGAVVLSWAILIVLLAPEDLPSPASLVVGAIKITLFVIAFPIGTIGAFALVTHVYFSLLGRE